jgi:hypothetical protein
MLVHKAVWSVLLLIERLFFVGWIYNEGVFRQISIVFGNVIMEFAKQI